VTVTIVNGQLLANLVILSRASEKDKSALLIEGDKDGRIYKKVIDPHRCRIFAAGNRDIAIEALKTLKKADQKGVLAIVDADTDYLTKAKSADPDVLLTHTRDAEGILLESPALKNVLIEFDVEEAFGVAPETALIQAAVQIGYARFVAFSKGWNVKTTQLDFSKFIDPVTLKCDSQKLCKHMASLTSTHGITEMDYEKNLEILSNSGNDPMIVARGHDATSILAWAIPIVGGRKRKNGALITSYAVESYLRTAYPREAFAKCALHGKIVAWEQRSAPYKILLP
jgi:hypothetical protein